MAVYTVIVVPHSPCAVPCNGKSSNIVRWKRSQLCFVYLNTGFEFLVATLQRVHLHKHRLLDHMQRRYTLKAKRVQKKECGVSIDKSMQSHRVMEMCLHSRRSSSHSAARGHSEFEKRLDFCTYYCKQQFERMPSSARFALDNATPI